MIYRLSSCIALIFSIFVSSLQAIETEAKQAIVYDFNTGEILFEKNGDEIMVPSSMTKIMTAHLVFERIRDGQLKYTDVLPISEKAWRMEGSKMFVGVNTEVPVEDLLKGVIVQSGNDASVALAEGLSGSEATFAEEMTARAKAMGAQNTVFLNSSGMPDEGHQSTAKDLAIMAAHTIKEFPDEYQKYYTLVDYTYNDIKQGNRNPLLYKNLGSGIVADGMKTGHTESGGYGLVGSAIQNGHRLIVVVNGLPSHKTRDQEATALLTWGFSEFKNQKFFSKGDVVDQVDVWAGNVPSIPVVAGDAVEMVLPRSVIKDMVVKAVYNAPLQAPLKIGDVVGHIEIAVPGKPVKQIPLVAGQDAEKAGFFNRIGLAVDYLLWGKSRS